MATKEKTAAEDMEAAQTAAPDPNERVEIYIPRSDRTDDPNYYVGVNAYKAILPRGETSLVPRYAAEEIKRALAEEDNFYKVSKAKEFRGNLG